MTRYCQYDTFRFVLNDSDTRVKIRVKIRVNISLTGPSEVVRVSQASTTFLCRAASVEHTKSFKPGAYKSSGRSSAFVTSVTSVSVGCSHKQQTKCFKCAAFPVILLIHLV